MLEKERKMSQSEEKKLTAETIRQDELQYVLYPWVAQKGLNPLVIDHAKGNYFYDTAGKKYLDFTSMFVFSNLGHADDRVVQAISRQAAKLPTTASPFATEPKAQLARMLAEVTPGDIKKTFFSTSGAEANEGAIKLARMATGKEKIIARYRTYHGSTMGAMALSNDFRNWACEPSIPGVVHCLDPYCYRCPFGLTYPGCDLQCAKHVEDVIRFEGGARRVAGFIAEPIVGANGIVVPPDGYWQKIREICDRYEVLMMCDEVMTGFGRTGKWFAIEHWGVVPDVITMAKGITSGYVPLGATSVRPGVAEKFETNPWVHGHTYSGHTLAMAAGVATIQAYRADGLIERSAEMGKYLMDKAKELQEKHVCIGDVRGKGLFVGLELVKNRKTKEPIHDGLVEGLRPPTAKMKVLGEAMKEGVYCLPGSVSVIMLAPPLTIEKNEIDWAVDVFDRALKIADAEVAG
ncbi:MAG: aminotransferase class III-fold pyridoxal phosphate-dependent enzyme [Deltaproteobacteria bacterium]|nr:MAG: aminotransferase class III-fold pyridoxal phosphate-dependent enzyme [Deltaproteobacteria bacterium]